MQLFRKTIACIIYCMLTISLIGISSIVNASPATLRPTDLPGIGTAVLPAQIQVQRIQESSVPEYNLTIDDGNVIHFARVKITNDPNMLYEFWGANIISSKAKDMAATIQKVSIENDVKAGAQLINTYLPHTSRIGKYDGWTTGYRTSTPSPMYTRVYLLNSARKNITVIYTCPDSDKKYWEPIIKQLITSLNSPVIIYPL